MAGIRVICAIRGFLPCGNWVYRKRSFDKRADHYRTERRSARRSRHNRPVAPRPQGSLAPPPPDEPPPELELPPEEDDDELLEPLEELELLPRVTVTGELTTSLPALRPIMTVYTPA